MIVDEIHRRLNALKQAAQDFNQFAALIDGNFDSKQTEIKALEQKRDRLKQEVDEIANKANSILQNATEQASVITKQANALLEEAHVSKLQAKNDIEESQRKIGEANSLMFQAVQKQKEADVQYRINEDKAKRLMEVAKS